MSTRKGDGRGRDHEAAREDAFAHDDIDVVFDDEEFDAAWDGERAEAVNVLREALPEIRQLPIPRAVLRDAATAVRRSLARGGWTYTAMRRAAGWAPNRVPKDDLELWLGAAGGLIEARDETGMGVEEESALMALEVADWLGAVLGLVRAGVGAPESARRPSRWTSCATSMNVRSSMESATMTTIRCSCSRSSSCSPRGRPQVPSTGTED